MSPFGKSQSTTDFIRLVNDWLLQLEHNGGRSSSTVRTYDGCLQRLINWCLDPPGHDHLRPSTANPWLLSMDDLVRFAGIYCHSCNISVRSRRVFVSALRGFYAWAASPPRQAVPDLAAKLPYPKAGRPLPHAISLTNADRMLREPDLSTFLGLRDAAIMALLMGTGMRVSGICSLNESALIWTVIDDHDDLVLRVTEKGGKERLLPVPLEAAMLVRAYLGHPELVAIDRWLPSGDQVLFVTSRNRSVPPWDYRGEARRISEYTVRDLLAKHGKAAKVPATERNPHALRHLYGTELTESDTPTLTAQALMGHTEAKSTEIYTHLAMRKLRQVVDRANPLAKMQTPVLEDLRRISAAGQPAHGRSRPRRA